MYVARGASKLVGACLSPESEGRAVLTIEGDDPLGFGRGLLAAAAGLDLEAAPGAGQAEEGLLARHVGGSEGDGYGGGYRLDAPGRIHFY